MYLTSREEFVLNSLAIFGKTNWDIEYLRDIGSLSNKKLVKIEYIYPNEHVTISKRLSHNSKVKSLAKNKFMEYLAEQILTDMEDDIQELCKSMLFSEVSYYRIQL